MRDSLHMPVRVEFVSIPNQSILSWLRALPEGSCTFEHIAIPWHWCHIPADELKTLMALLELARRQRYRDPNSSYTSYGSVVDFCGLHSEDGLQRVLYQLRQRRFLLYEVQGGEFIITVFGEIEDWEAQNLKLHGPPPQPYVYFLKSEDTGLIKIGWSFRPETRKGPISRQAKEKLTLLATIPGGQDVESALHRQFSHCRAQHPIDTGGREWFTPTPELLAYVEANTGRADLAETTD